MKHRMKDHATVPMKLPAKDRGEDLMMDIAMDPMTGHAKDLV